MSLLSNRDESNGQEFSLDSSDVVIIEVRGNEDTTTRPLRPALLEWAKRQGIERPSSPEAPTAQ